jgi:hypothetical protein
MGGVEGALWRHRRLLIDRVRRGPEEDQGVRAGHARQRRPDRDARRFRSAVGQIAEERNVEDPQGLPAPVPTMEAATINANLLAILQY